MAATDVYVDSCCFIDAAKYDVSDEAVRAVLNAQQVKDLALSRQVLTAARDGRVKAYTSGLTIAECTSIEKGDAKPTDEIKKLFRAMLLSGRVVTLVEPHIFLCEQARDLRWDHGIVLGGADAIHLATAIAAECGEFLTTDGKILKKAKAIQAEFGIRLIRPASTLCLPDDYRQEAMPWRGQESHRVKVVPLPRRRKRR